MHILCKSKFTAFANKPISLPFHWCYHGNRSNKTYAIAIPIGLRVYQGLCLRVIGFQIVCCSHISCHHYISILFDNVRLLLTRYPGDFNVDCTEF